MRLLILTQKVDKNDDVLGFFHRWIQEFAARCEKVIVVCLSRGPYDLPANVEVISLGKEAGGNKFSFAKKFLWTIWARRNDYDSVFVHMNPIYVVLGGWLWRLFGKKIVLWYTHKNVDAKLRIAEVFSNVIVTASAESFKLASSKVEVVGHGVPVEEFVKPDVYTLHRDPNIFQIVSVGRITPIKNLDVLIRALGELVTRGVDARVTLVGTTGVVSDEVYMRELQTVVRELHLEQRVRFAGAMPNTQIASAYWESDVSVNLCPDGGVDKAVLESMASGCIPFASNRAFAEYFGEYKNALTVAYRDPADLANKLDAIRVRADKDDIRAALQKTVRERSDVRALIEKLVGFLK